MIDLPLIFHLYRGVFAIHLLAKIKVLIVQFENVLILHVQITLQCTCSRTCTRAYQFETLNLKELEHVFVKAFNRNLFLC